MENKFSDDELKDVLEQSDDGTIYTGKFVHPVIVELLDLRANAKTSKLWNTDVIMPLIDQLRDAGYTGTLSEMIQQACALQEATRWIPVGEGVIPMDILLEIGNTKTGIVDVAVYG
ncbi:MAG: hypothetical protein PHD39_09155, partial [Methylobacter tundripaludum]|nr:hypothetical protein [Methylobacter tundripaludum]